MKIKRDEDLPKAVAEMVRKHILDTVSVAGHWKINKKNLLWG
jgi:2-methylcitrate dehydratase PrpD